MNCISCLTWIPRGVAKSEPDKLQLDPQELKNLIEESRAEAIELLHDEEDEQMDEDQNVDENDDDKDFNARYNLDNYDDDDDDKPIFSIGDLAVHADNNDDEYVTVKDADDESEKDEQENILIKDTDNLLVVGHVEEDSSVMEIYVYNKDDEAFYVHHDIVLPAYPIVFERLDFHQSEESGNFVAVGDMTPIIKVWDLDVVDILEPEYKLGISRKKAKKAENLSKGHSDAVLALSWNKNLRHILASGSADSTVILWNLETLKVENKLEYHSDKVQDLQWNPSEPQYLLSGCVDGSVKLRDCKDLSNESKSWKVKGEVEKVLWDVSNSSHFFCSTEEGFVYKMDIRMNIPIYSFIAHKKAVTGLDMNPQCPTVLLTASMDETTALWDLSNKDPVLVRHQKLKLGSIYAAKIAPDLGFTVAVGGDSESNNIKIIDILDDSDCRKFLEANLIPSAVTNKTEVCKMETHEESASTSHMEHENGEASSRDTDTSRRKGKSSTSAKLKKQMKKEKNKN